MIEKVKEIVALINKRRELLEELRAIVIEKGEELREFKDGEVVEVIAYNGSVKCEGIVDGAYSSLLNSMQDYDLLRYAQSPDKFESDLNEIRYKVKALKKDGTKSERNADGRSSYGTIHKSYDYHIRKKQ